jgi:HipA-like protein
MSAPLPSATRNNQEHMFGVSRFGGSATWIVTARLMRRRIGMSRLGRLLRLQYSSPLCTVQIFDGETPIAELSLQQGRYLFRYLESFKRKGLTPFPGLPEVDEVYESAELFPYFEERIPDNRVPAIRNWISRKGLPADDKLTLLTVLGRMVATDSYEIRLKAD